MVETYLSLPFLSFPPHVNTGEREDSHGRGIRLRFFDSLALLVPTRASKQSHRNIIEIEGFLNEKCVTNSSSFRT